MTTAIAFWELQTVPLDYVREIARLKTERNAVVLAHNCPVGEIQDVADEIGDSLGLSQQAAQTDAGILHALRKQNPQKQFHAVAEPMLCRFMKLITLEKLYRALEDNAYEVTVAAPIAERARLPIERMLATV